MFLMNDDKWQNGAVKYKFLTFPSSREGGSAQKPHPYSIPDSNIKMESYMVDFYVGEP